MKTILISGATGLIGKKLKEKLISRKYEVRILSRKNMPGNYMWDLSENYVDKRAFENLDAIIHLAGSPISKKWTKTYKKEIYDSRVKTSKLLLDYTKKYAPDLKTFITASGSNYYGTLTSGKIFVETDPHTSNFLGNLCFDLEKTAEGFEAAGSRICAVRTSAVLSSDGGMLEKLLPLAYKNLLSPLGSGKQIIPWIHIDDITDLYIYLLENENLVGAFNAAAPQIVSNYEFTHTLVKCSGRKIILPPVPGFILKVVLGEMSSVLLEGSAISSEKIKKAGFEFKFENLKSAMEDLLK